MSLKEKLLLQFGRPTGIMGRIAGWLMTKTNWERNRWAVEKMDPGVNDIILEIGYGTGTTANIIAEKLKKGKLIGVDHSDLMYRQANKVNRKHLLDKKVVLHNGTIWELDYKDDTFDLAFGSNVHFFWSDPVAEYRRLHHLIKPGGKIVLVFQPMWVKSDCELYITTTQAMEDLRRAGFQNVDYDYKNIKPVTCVYISGRKLI